MADSRGKKSGKHKPSASYGAENVNGGVADSYLTVDNTSTPGTAVESTRDIAGIANQTLNAGISDLPSDTNAVDELVNLSAPPSPADMTPRASPLMNEGYVQGDEESGAGGKESAASKVPPSEHGTKASDQSKVQVVPTVSKYDYVKVRVWLGDHYYILSRFLICRYLTVTKVSQPDSIKIALELKKVLVDAGRFDVTHKEMERTLFAIVLQFGYGQTTIAQFRLMARFHHLRVPLILLISGTCCTGKSTLATQLSERLNLPSVLQTDLVYEVMKSLGPRFDFPDLPIWYRQFESDEHFLESFASECAVIKQGLEGDIHKCLEEGKSIIIEGHHLDLQQYQDLLCDPDFLVKAKDRSDGKDAPKRKDKPFIVVPFLITVDDVERMVFLDNHLRSANMDRSALGITYEEQRSTLLHNFKLAESYLQESASTIPSTQVVRMSHRSFPEALEALADVIVDRIRKVVEQMGSGDDDDPNDDTPRRPPSPSSEPPQPGTAAAAYADAALHRTQ